MLFLAELINAAVDWVRRVDWPEAVAEVGAAAGALGIVALTVLIAGWVCGMIWSRTRL